MTKRDTITLGEKRVRVAIMILAKDEEQSIGQMLDAIANQSLCDRSDVTLSVYVGANGCSDATADVARRQGEARLAPAGIETHAFDWGQPGKSRSWNRMVHEIIPADVDYIMAMDADIRLASDRILELLFDQLSGQPALTVVSGFPVKDIVRKARPNLINRFSMSISKNTRHSGVVNGSLYLARADRLREIWLPDDTPGEDGFLNAMIMTRGFSQQEQPELVDQLSEPSHYFEGHSAGSYFTHERRMIVGTMINRWIFEHLHALRLSEPAGPIIDRLNRDDPDWVEGIIARRSAGRWLIPNEITFRRLIPTRGIGLSYLVRLPIFLAATVLTVPPAFKANKVLKQKGASSLW